MEVNKGKVVSKEAWTLEYSGLAKAAPAAQGLTQKTYRSYRRRLDLLSRQCQRRGAGVAIEGAFLILSQLQDVAWDAIEPGLWWHRAGGRPLQSDHIGSGCALPTWRRSWTTRAMPGILRAIPTRKARRTTSIPGATSNGVEKAQSLERSCAPAASWMASADASWHSTMDSPTGEINV